MPSYPFNSGTVRMNTRKGWFVFKPTGDLYYTGKRKNPFTSLSGDSIVARFMVGFNVSDKSKWSMPDLVGFTRDYLRKTVIGEDSTFIYQRGVYTHEEKRKGKKPEVVEEDSGQVLIMKTTDKVSTDGFFKIMIRLCEHLCKVMIQEKIYLQKQINGIITATYEITASKPKRGT